MKQISLTLAFVLTLTSTMAYAEPKVFIRSNGQFVANGNEYARGFWIPSVNGAEEVFNEPLALQEYRDHVDDAQWFGILGWGAIGAFATYTLISASNDSFNAGTGLVIFAVPAIASFIMGTKSNRHLLKAINIMNDVPPDQARQRFTPQNELQRQRYSLVKPLEIPLLAWTF